MLGCSIFVSLIINQLIEMKKILLLVAVLVAVVANAQDRVFTYTYESGVLNKGQKEIEVGSTFLRGHQNYFKGQENRLEFEIGLGGKLQTSFYLNNAYSTGIEDDNGVQTVNSEVEYSFSNEWKLKLSDPVANRIGSALYFEYTVAPTATELEGKIIFDKHIGKFVHALNLVGEYVLEKEFVANGTKLTPTNASELFVEFNYGLSYKIKDNIGVGFEAMDQNEFVNSTLQSSVLMMGPVVAYSTNGFWINLTCMPQITNFKGGGLELINHERLQTRLMFSYAF